MDKEKDPRGIPIVPQQRRPSAVLLAPDRLAAAGSRSASPRSVSPPAAPVEVVLAGRARRRSSNSGNNRPRVSFGAASANKPPLSTHSPIALAAASAVTPERMLKLLESQGPLAIRHITSHLAKNIEGFGELSLSKQRRLIIAVLDNGDPAKNIYFEKVGWGRWAVQGDERAKDGSTPEEDDQDLSPPASPQKIKAEDRRESISNALPRHRLPLSPGLQPVEDAVFSDSEEEVNTDEEDWQSLGPLRRTSQREQDAIQALVQLNAG